jgi:hypothetical protein
MANLEEEAHPLPMVRYASVHSIVLSWWLNGVLAASALDWIVSPSCSVVSRQHK